MFHKMFVHIIFSSVWVAEWPPLGKELLMIIRLTICYLCILTTGLPHYNATFGVHRKKKHVISETVL